MTAQGEPLRLYPTRRRPVPVRPSPEWQAAKADERERTDLFGRTRAAVMRLVKVIDDVTDLDRDGYLDVGVERLQLAHERAAELLFELGSELTAVLLADGYSAVAVARMQRGNAAHMLAADAGPEVLTNLGPDAEPVDDDPDPPRDREAAPRPGPAGLDPTPDEETGAPHAN